MPSRNRVLVIGLDGVELACVERYLEGGELPHLAALRARSATFLLDNPPERRTGLEWEHLTAALPAGRTLRESQVTFDPATYDIRGSTSEAEPFLERLDARTVVLDLPYCDLRRAPSVKGMVAWGSHDPGAPRRARPPSLLDELGPYPSPGAIYDVPWPSPGRCRAMGEALVAGLDARAEVAVRLMTELTPDWEVFVAVSGELHSGSEALWHGIDPDHPLHGHPSADAAGVALHDAHRALDRFVGRLLEAAGEDAFVVAFSPGGMGANTADVPTMVLLPELLHRWSFGTPRLRDRPEWSAAPDGVPVIDPDDSWEAAVLSLLDRSRHGRVRAVAGRLPRPVREWLRRARRRLGRAEVAASESMAWMPAARYADEWPLMEAFALPSFYQGRVRVNLDGRERDGRVPPDRLAAVLDEVEDVLNACTDPRTGQPLVARIDRPVVADPLVVPPDHADLVVYWNGSASALEHPDLGLVGPVPYRRTGGHTGPLGFCYVSGPGIAPGEEGRRPAAAVAPTIAALAGDPIEQRESLIDLPTQAR